MKFINCDGILQNVFNHFHHVFFILNLSCAANQSVYFFETNPVFLFISLCFLYFSSSSDDFPVPLALPVYSSVPPGVGRRVERPLSVHRGSGLPLLWSVRPPARRELRGPGHKHHLPVSTNPPSLETIPLMLSSLDKLSVWGAESLLQSSVCLHHSAALSRWILYGIIVCRFNYRAGSHTYTVQHFSWEPNIVSFAASFLFFLFPNHITARSWVLSLETRPFSWSLGGNGYFCSVRLILIWRECIFQVRSIMVYIIFGLITHQTVLGWSALP